MAELADAPDLKSVELIPRGGSTPPARTNLKMKLESILFDGGIHFKGTSIWGYERNVYPQCTIYIITLGILDLGLTINYAKRPNSRR